MTSKRRDTYVLIGLPSINTLTACFSAGLTLPIKLSWASTSNIEGTEVKVAEVIWAAFSAMLNKTDKELLAIYTATDFCRDRTTNLITCTFIFNTSGFLKGEGHNLSTEGKST